MLETDPSTWVLILYKHLVNVFQKTYLWWWPAEFCHFWRFLSLLSLRDSLWAFNRHKFDYRVPSRADCERQKLLVQVNWVLQVDMGFLLKTRRQFHTIEVPTCCFLMWSTIQNNCSTTTLSKSLSMNRMIKMKMSIHIGSRENRREKTWANLTPKNVRHRVG